MTRLIPGKTKVDVELFRGITLGDIAVALVGVAMIILVVLSTLPYKFAICIGVAAVVGLLLFRIDDQPNYRYLLHILTFFGYDRHFAKRLSDQHLLERGEGNVEEAAFDELFRQEGEKEAGKTDKKARKANEKERAQKRKEEDKLLKSKKVSEEEKEAIRERRKRESADAARRMADAKDAATSRKSVDGIIGFTQIRNGVIEYHNGEYYGAAIEIDPVEFRFFSEHRRQNSIEVGVGRVLRAVNPKYSANIVKLERPIRYEGYLDKEYEKLFQLRDSYESGLLTEDELKARVEVEYDRINELQSLCGDEKVVTGFYYIVLFESDKRQLELQVSNALSNLQQGEMTARRLNDKELAVFLKYSNALDFDEHEIDRIAPEDYAQWAMPDTVDVRARRIEVNHVITHNFRVSGFPSMVGDAWLAGIMSIPGTKVVVKAKPMDRQKAIRSIDRSLMELRGQWSATGVDSRRMEIEEHLSTLQELLGTLQADNESLLECNVYVTAYDIIATRNNVRIKQPGPSMLPNIAEMKKTVRRAWQESGFRLNNMEFEQPEAFVGSQVNGLDPLAKQGRGIPSNTVAACYPWIYAHISDEGGVKLGSNDGIPVFIDFFRRDSERVNSNMVIVGKSGSGKSYATKSILSNLAADDAKIFILDPENEYTELAGNLHGKIINVGNAQYGRLNPFHIITALDDDEAGENGPSGSYATHLQFLEEFFRQIMPDCEKDAMEYLNTLIDRLYLDHNITAETNLSLLTPADYPIFDDLYDEILLEFQRTDNAYTRDMLRTLMNYVAKFSTGGRNANIWNGPSTVTTDTNFTVFNFQSMLANRNQTVANAQMLLVLKYIDNEIIKNRDYNMKYGLKRKVVVVIDEAHVFIDSKYPIALDFMFQLAKRIRKYNGMQIVITQNIKDFVGSEEIARKSTAIINACQYSFIFALAPNDMQDLVKLYENAGGINESEQEQIVQAPRGQAFTIMSPTSRSTFRVETGESMIHMFEDRDYVSRYFSNEEGAANWEDFIADSRAAHDEAVMARRDEQPEEEEESSSPRSFFMFEEIDEDDAPTASQTGSTVSNFETEAETNQAEAEPAKGFTAHAHAVPEERGFAGRNAGDAEQGMAMDAVMGMFDVMTSKITEAFERVGMPVAPEMHDAAEEESSALTAQLAAKDAELSEKDAEIKRLRAEMERLKNSAAAEPEIDRAEDEEPSTAESEADWGGDEESNAAESEADWVADENLDVDESEINWPEDEDFLPDEPTDAEEVEEEDEDEGEDSTFNLLSFLNRSLEYAKSLNFVEQMRRSGKDSAEISLPELVEYLESIREEARKNA